MSGDWRTPDVRFSVTFLFLLTIVVWTCGLLVSVAAHSDGAPPNTCDSMLPRHSNYTAQTGPSPFGLTVVEDTVEGGGSVTVTLNALDDVTFLGFIIKAFPVVSVNETVGRFNDSGITSYKRLECDETQVAREAATHTEAIPRQSLTFTWMAPTFYYGEATFIATVVSNFSEFWTKVNTSIFVNGTNTTPGPPTTTVAPPYKYDDCGVTRGCLGSPENCLRNSDCRNILKYSPSQSDKGLFDFELSSKSDGYVAIGFSDDVKMGNDFVVQCIMNGDVLTAFTSYNEGHDNYIIWEFNETSPVSGSYIDGIITCAFSLPSITYIEPLNMTFNIQDELYYLMLVEGPIRNVGEGEVYKHDEDPVVSTDKVNVSVVIAPSPPPSFDYSACGISAGCFGLPDACIYSKDCSILLEYSPSTDQIGQFDFTMSSSYNGYVAMGFSDDSYMGDDAVVQCLLDGSNVKAFSSYNTDDPKDNVPIGLLDSFKTGTFEGGILSCSFSLPSIISDNQVVYFLENETYYLMLAEGPVINPTVGSIDHHVQRIVSSDRINISDVYYVVSGESVDVKILIHGSFMVVAWIGTVAVAIFLARYYKDMWPDKLHLTTKIWFTYHRCLNVLTVLFALVAFILIFVYVGGFSEVWHVNPHPVLGTIAFGLMIIQPIGAVFRPAPGTAHRPWFNWGHYLVGMLSWAFALMAIFYAVSLPSAVIPEYVTWIIVAYVAYCIIMFSLMEYSNQLCAVKKTETHELRELGDNNNAVQNKEKMSEELINFKKIMLLLFVMGIVAFTTALIIIICV